MEKSIKKKCVKHWLLIGSSGNFTKVKGNPTGKTKQDSFGEKGVKKDIDRFMNVIKRAQGKTRLFDHQLFNVILRNDKQSDGVKNVLKGIGDFIKRIMEEKYPKGCIYYTGYSEKFTGNWCFKRKNKLTTISLQQIVSLIPKSDKKVNLTVYSDCSYSAQWIDQLDKL